MHCSGFEPETYDPKSNAIAVERKKVVGEFALQLFVVAKQVWRCFLDVIGWAHRPRSVIKGT